MYVQNKATGSYKSIMDKNLGTNLHFWHFCARARREYSFTCLNLVPRAHVSFDQRQDTELWNNQFPETKIIGLPVSRRMRSLAKNMVYRYKVDVDAY